MSPKNGKLVPRAALLVVVGLLLATAGGALAQGPPIVNQTDHIVDETSTNVDGHPCTGEPAELTVSESGVIHLSIFADGTVHFTGTLHGRFSADALPTDGTPDGTRSSAYWPMPAKSASAPGSTINSSSTKLSTSELRRARSP